jgi:hypothetical protein
MDHSDGVIMIKMTALQKKVFLVDHKSLFIQYLDDVDGR